MKIIVLAALSFLALLAVTPATPVSAESEPPAALEETVVPGAPTFREVIDLVSVGSVCIAPDGSAVAWTERTTDWDENRYDTEIWVAKRQGDGPFGEGRQFTRTASGSASSPAFSPDGRWLSFISTRGEGDEAKPQVYRMALAGGEAEQLTDAEEGVGSYRWSPDSESIAFVSSAEDDPAKEREDTYGAYRVEDQDLRHQHLFIAEATPGAAARQLTEGTDITVDDLEFSPDGRTIAIGHRPRPQIDAFPEADVSLVDSRSGDRRPLVREAGSDGLGFWSPDGEALLITTPRGASDWYGNSRLAKVDVASGQIETLTEFFDEDAFPVAWSEHHGVIFGASQRTARRVFQLTTKGGAARALELGADAVYGAAFSDDGASVAFISETSTTLPEVFVASIAQPGARQQLTHHTEKTAEWPLGKRELTTWTSRDGTEIEGVLFLPVGHDRSRPAPLLVVIHGGPTGTSRPRLIGGYVYPIEQWLAKGAIVLMPNYRGSAGYGEAFRSLNVRNLGVGDAWDVESGVEALVARGLADPGKVGAMGWSQGGYISAFLATTSDKFKAISNGAGISNWMTYYVNTDIHGFTRAYLEATPWDDPEIYAKTSPMTYIKDAQTPTLIQHGEFDQRVPTPNAFELYQGLQDVGVPTRLVIYRGFGHGINKPKERLAAVWHNWQWFEKWLWGNEVDLPVPPKDDEEGSETPGKPEKAGKNHPPR